MSEQPPVAVTVSTCLGVQPGKAMLALVFTRPDGALHVVEMPEPTALAVELAIRTRFQAPPCAPQSDEVTDDPE